MRYQDELRKMKIPTKFHSNRCVQVGYVSLWRFFVKKRVIRGNAYYIVEKVKDLDGQIEDFIYCVYTVTKSRKKRKLKKYHWWYTSIFERWELLLYVLYYVSTTQCHCYYNGHDKDSDG